MWQHEIICYRKYIAKVIYNKQFAKTRHNHELFARNPYYVGIRKSTTFTHIWIKVENSILALESGSSPGFSSLGSLVAVSLMGSASIKKITNSHDMFWAIKILVTAEDWVMRSAFFIPLLHNWKLFPFGRFLWGLTQAAVLYKPSKYRGLSILS